MRSPGNASVRVRALMFYERSVVIVREMRHGQPHLSLPGGRVKEGESVADAVSREIREETGLSVQLGPLVYVAEVLAPHRRHDLNLIFQATPAGPSENLELMPLDSDESDLVLPPVLGRVRQGLKDGWPKGAQWLGNVWNSELALR